jgi:hypothetical protein
MSYGARLQGRSALARLGAWHRQEDNGAVARSPEVAVSLDELETAVRRLPDEELAAFAQWFEEFLADAWDRRIEADIQAGRIDEAGRRVEADFEAGRCKPL